jgi:hypothetical protein
VFTACVYGQYDEAEYEEWISEQESVDEWKALDTSEIMKIFGRDVRRSYQSALLIACLWCSKCIKEECASSAH